MAGYFAGQASTPLTIELVQPLARWHGIADGVLHFDGVGRGDSALLKRLNDSLERNLAAILAVLAAYQVPVLPDAFAEPWIDTGPKHKPSDHPAREVFHEQKSRRRLC